MALSQLLGGWTKWGWPRVSGNVFLLAFLPTFVVGGWVLAAQRARRRLAWQTCPSWSGDLGIDGFVGDLGLMIPAIAFGIGLVFGFTFDTTGPQERQDEGRPCRRSAEAGDRGRQRDGRGSSGPAGRRRHRRREPEPAPRTGEPAKK